MTARQLISILMKLDDLDKEIMLESKDHTYKIKDVEERNTISVLLID